MKFSLRSFLYIFAIGLAFVFTACVEDEATPSLEVDPITFAEAVPYAKDGSFNFTLNHDQIRFILTNEFNQEAPDDPLALIEAFNRVTVQNQPGNDKLTAQQKMTTFSILTVVTSTPNNGGTPTSVFDGIGGLIPGVSADATFSCSLVRPQCSNLVTAHANAYDSNGDGVPGQAYADSSFDVPQCERKCIFSRVKGEGKMS
ncbi:MAG: hypothetical protein AAF597_21360, partial [Bacteroidota bacterium]